MTDIALFWWILSALSILFVVVDWAHAPIDTTMHLGFVLIAGFMGPLGAILYVLTVREPLPGTHTAYIAPTWKQVVGSTFHCVAGDSVGIVGAAIITSTIHMSMLAGLLTEYAAGFLVGWLVFQSLFMKDMVGGSYWKAVRSMFMPEWVSMNGVMAGMAVVMVVWMKRQPVAGMPGHALFWFMMSMALIAGAVVAYPLNWWLVTHHLKHGIMSTAGEMRMSMHHMGHERNRGIVASPSQSTGHASHHGTSETPSGGMHHGDPTEVLSSATAHVHPYASPVVAMSVGVLIGALALALWIG